MNTSSVQTERANRTEFLDGMGDDVKVKVEIHLNGAVDVGVKSNTLTFEETGEMLEKIREIGIDLASKMGLRK